MARRVDLKAFALATLATFACRTDLPLLDVDGGAAGGGGAPANAVTTTGSPAVTTSAGSTSSTTDTTTSGSPTTTTGSGGEGAGGSGQGGGGPVLCVPGEVVACYSGPAGTLDVGLCHAGAQICNDDGSAFGPCEDEVTPSAEDCVVPGDANCDGVLPSCPGDALWSVGAGDSGIQTGRSIASDPSGNVLVAGDFEGSLDLGGGVLTSAGDDDVFVVTLDPDGNHLWSKRFGDAQNQTAVSIASDSAGNVLVAGNFRGSIDLGGGALENTTNDDVFVAKLSSTGDHLWSKQFGGPNTQHVAGVAVDAAGNVVLAGTFRSSIDLGGGPLSSAGGEDIFIAKLDSGGNHLWSKSFGDTSRQAVSSVALDSVTAEVVLAGHFGGTLDFNGAVLQNIGGADAYVVKLDGAGNHVWSRSFEGALSAGPLPVALAPTGELSISGLFIGDGLDFGGGALPSYGHIDVFAASFDASGATAWSKSFGGSEPDEVYAIASSGDVVLTGAMYGHASFGGPTFLNQGGTDIFLAKLDPMGTHLWSRQFGDLENQWPTSVAIDPTDHVLLTGGFAGVLDFGDGPLTSAGTHDVFIAKLAP